MKSEKRNTNKGYNEYKYSNGVELQFLTRSYAHGYFEVDMSGILRFTRKGWTDRQVVNVLDWDV